MGNLKTCIPSEWLKLARQPEFQGRKLTIRAFEFPDGPCPVGDFLDQLDPSDRRKLDTLFEMLGNQGQIRNKQKFKKVEGSDKIFEFKSFQIRILCSFSGRSVYLLHALVKKSDKLKKSDIKRAERVREEYLE